MYPQLLHRDAGIRCRGLCRQCLSAVQDWSYCLAAQQLLSQQVAASKVGGPLVDISHRELTGSCCGVVHCKGHPAASLHSLVPQQRQDLLQQCCGILPRALHAPGEHACKVFARGGPLQHMRQAIQWLLHSAGHKLMCTRQVPFCSQEVTNTRRVHHCCNLPCMSCGTAGLCRVAGVRNRKGPSVLHSSCDWTLCPRAFHGSPAGAQSDSSHGLCTAHRHPTKAHLVKLVPRQRPQLVQALKQDPDAVGQPRSNLHSSKPPCPYS